MILVPGCSDSDDTDGTHHEEIADECQAILDTCTHDVPGDLAAECHEVGHENDAEACAARKDECVTHCALEGLGGHGGGHGGGH